MILLSSTRKHLWQRFHQKFIHNLQEAIMKNTIFVFSLNSILLACLCTHTVFANPANMTNHKIKQQSVSFTLTQNQCYTAPSECLLTVTPSKWNQGIRTYSVDKICDYDDAQLLYNHTLPLKEQIAERKFLGRKLCNGVVTISNMDLPFSKFHSDNSPVSDPNDGLLLIEVISVAIQDINHLLREMSILAYDAASGVHTSSELGYMNTKFQNLLNEVGRVSTSTQYNGVALLDGSVSFVKIPIHKHDSMDYISLSFMTATPASLSIASLSIESSVNAQSALRPLTEATSSMESYLDNLMLKLRPRVVAAANAEAAITTIDLTGPQFVVHQEQALESTTAKHI
jgi:hypothetical protein